MYSVVIFNMLLSVISLYALTEKLEIQKTGIILWLSKKATISRFVAIGAFLIGAAILIVKSNIVSGILASILVWILLACMVSLFAPFKKVRVMHMVLFFTSLVLVEALYFLI